MLTGVGLSSMNDVDAIAVTKGPGLEICLRVGFKKAQQLARESGKPFVTVHHLEAHCVMARLAGKEIVAEESASTTTPAISDNNNNSNDVATAPARTDNNEFFMPKVAYPFLALLASGGHTSILLCKVPTTPPHDIISISPTTPSHDIISPTTPPHDIISPHDIFLMTSYLLMTFFS